MGHAAGARRPETSVPRLELAIARKVLRNVAPLAFGVGRECTFFGALAVATTSDYDWLLGCSGGAFETLIDAEGWDPIAATPHHAPTLERGARAAGVRLDPVPPPYDDEMRELVLARVAEAIDAELPPLVRGFAGPPEFGVIVGYDESGPAFFARTYFDKTDAPARAGWEVFEDERRGLPIFLDRGEAVERAALARTAITAAVAAGEETERAPATAGEPAVKSGRAAFEAWVSALRDDARWSDARHTATAAFSDHAMRVLLADKRRAAARFLRGIRGMFMPAAAADLLRAAEAYGYVAEAAEKAGTATFDGAAAMRFVDAGQRRAWANLLEGALRHEQEAQDALRSAHATMR